MANLDLTTVELVTTLRTAPKNGAASSSDYNDTQRELLADLATIAGFLNDKIVPLMSALPASALEPEQTPVGIEGRTVYADTSDTTALFFDAVAAKPLTVADSMRVMNTLLSASRQLVLDLATEVASLQTRLSSTNQNDISLALQSISATLAQLLQEDVEQNIAITLLEENTSTLAGGKLAVTMVDADYTLTEPQATGYLMYQFLGTLTAGRTVNIPTVNATGAPLTRMFLVLNDTGGGQSITFASGSGSMAVVADASSAVIYSDGVNVFAISGGSGSSINLVTSVAGRTGNVVLSMADISGLIAALALKAPLASPALTGVPTGPTASAHNNSVQLATTAYVDSAVSTATGGATPVTSVAGRTGDVLLGESDITSLSADLSAINAALALKAPINSPSFTGTPVAPTPATSDNSTKLATTAWVKAQTSPYDVYLTAPGVFSASQLCMFVPILRAVTFTANFAGSAAYLQIAATATTIFAIRKNGTQVATITFAAGGTIGTFSVQAAIGFVFGDLLSVTAPVTPDTTATTLGLGLTGIR